MNPATRRALTWLVATLTLFAQSGAPVVVRAQGGMYSAVGEGGRLVDPERAFAVLEAALAVIPRDSFDPAAVADALGPDPEAAFAFVRDATALVPYRGALRGPVGVLMDRVGNSLDRALLLSDLLDRHGVTSRLVRGTLAHAEAEALLDRAWGGAARPTSPPTDAARTVDGATSLGVDVGELASSWADRRAAADAFERELTRRIDAHAEALLALVGRPEANGDERAAQVEAARDHWWVEVRSGDAWIALDPTTADALPGDTWTEGHERLAVASVLALPDEIVHGVRVRIVLECVAAGSLIEHALVSSPRLSAAALVDQHVSLEHVPIARPLNTSGLDDVGLRELLLEQDRWYPILRVGEQAWFERAFDADCVVGDATPPDLLGVGGVFRDAGNVFGGLFDLPASDAPTAMFLEVDIHAPGTATTTIRRTVFDRIGEASRTSGSAAAVVASADPLPWRLALLGGTDLLVLGAHPSPEFVVTRTAGAVQVNRPELLVVHAGEVDAEVAADLASKVARVPEDLYGLALARRTWTGFAGPSYLDRPNVLARHRQVLVRDDGSFATLAAFDIVANDVAVDARSGADAFTVRLRQGVLDTNAEALVAAEVCRALAHVATCVSAHNTAEAFDASLVAATPWTVARTPDDLVGYAGPADALARARAELAAGAVLVLPPASDGTRSAWWRIDPEDGTALGMLDVGWGGAGSEYAILLNSVTSYLGFMVCLKGVTPAGASGPPVGGMSLCLLGFGVGMVSIVVGHALLSAGIGFATAAAGAVSGSR